jgi:hypothetical protein
MGPQSLALLYQQLHEAFFIFLSFFLNPNFDIIISISISIMYHVSFFLIIIIMIFLPLLVQSNTSYIQNSLL